MISDFGDVVKDLPILYIHDNMKNSSSSSTEKEWSFLSLLHRSMNRGVDGFVRNFTLIKNIAVVIGVAWIVNYVWSFVK